MLNRSRGWRIESRELRAFSRFLGLWRPQGRRVEEEERWAMILMPPPVFGLLEGPRRQGWILLRFLVRKRSGVNPGADIEKGWRGITGTSGRRGRIPTRGLSASGCRSRTPGPVENDTRRKDGSGGGSKAHVAENTHTHLHAHAHTHTGARAHTNAHAQIHAHTCTLFLRAAMRQHTHGSTITECKNKMQLANML